MKIYSTFFFRQNFQNQFLQLSFLNMHHHVWSVLSKSYSKFYIHEESPRICSALINKFSYRNHIALIFVKSQLKPNFPNPNSPLISYICYFCQLNQNLSTYIYVNNESLLTHVLCHQKHPKLRFEAKRKDAGAEIWENSDWQFVVSNDSQIYRGKTEIQIRSPRRGSLSISDNILLRHFRILRG